MNNRHEKSRRTVLKRLAVGSTAVAGIPLGSSTAVAEEDKVTTYTDSGEAMKTSDRKVVQHAAARVDSPNSWNDESNGDYIHGVKLVGTKVAMHKTNDSRTVARSRAYRRGETDFWSRDKSADLSGITVNVDLPNTNSTVSPSNSTILTSEEDDFVSFGYMKGDQEHEMSDSRLSREKRNAVYKVAETIVGEAYDETLGKAIAAKNIIGSIATLASGPDDGEPIVSESYRGGGAFVSVYTYAMQFHVNTKAYETERLKITTDDGGSGSGIDLDIELENPVDGGGCPEELARTGRRGC